MGENSYLIHLASGSRLIALLVSGGTLPDVSPLSRGNERENKMEKNSGSGGVEKRRSRERIKKL